MRHLPFWFDSFPKSRRPSCPRFRGSHETRVAIVGGGLTGVSCALAFAGAGINVVLLEANLIGAAATAGSDGLLREGFNGPVHESIARHGVRITRALWEGSRRGSLELAAALRRLDVRCHLGPMDVLTIAPPRAEDAKGLRREQEDRKEVGADAPGSLPRQPCGMPLLKAAARCGLMRRRSIHTGRAWASPRRRPSAGP